MNSTINNNDVLQLKITISEDDNTASILETVSHVRPYWNTAKIKFKVPDFQKLLQQDQDSLCKTNNMFVHVRSRPRLRKSRLGLWPNIHLGNANLLTDGITNKLILCSHSYDGKKSTEYLLLRIYGNKTDLLIDRTAEIRNIKLLHTYDLAPQLYATLENGLVYEYLPGRTVSPEDVVRPEIYRLVAVEMAKMHKIKSPDPPKPAASLWATFQQFVDLIPDEFEDITKQKRFVELNFSKAQLLQEIRQFKEAVNDINIAVVFCHNDLLLGNIIYNETTNKVSFIDFEYACFNYQPFDIGNHFAEYAGVGDIDYSRYPKKSLQLDWLKYYLMEYKDIPKVSEYEIEELYVQVNKFVLLSHLLWFSWALIQAEHSYIDFDFIKYAGARLEEYFKRKSGFLSLKTSLPPIT